MTTNDFEIKFIELKRNTAARRREVTKKYDAELKDARDKRRDIKRQRSSLMTTYTKEKAKMLERNETRKVLSATIATLYANLSLTLDILREEEGELNNEIARLTTGKAEELAQIERQHDEVAKSLHEEYIQWLADRKEENKLSNRELKQACYNVYNYMRQRGKDTVVQHITETDAVEVKLVKLEPHKQTLQIS